MSKKNTRDHIEGLSQSKRALLERLLGGAETPTQVSCPITRREGSGPCILSFNQGRQWFLERLYPGSGAYNVASALRLEGPIDLPIMEAALAAVVARHEILRTRFFEQDGVPMQEVLEDYGVRFEVVDAAVSGKVAGPELDSSIRRVTGAALDMHRGPLLRIILFRLSDEEHVLVRSMNHMISDGWSGRILFRDLAQAYSALLRGSLPDWKSLPCQYSDFAVWQRGEFTRTSGVAQLEFWRKRLQDAPPSLALPTDRPRPALQEFAVAGHSLLIPGELARGLEGLAQEATATPFMVLIAAYARLLSLYCGEDDVVIGVPVAGRRTSGVEELIGFFTNSLPMRFDTSGDPTFRELLERARTVAIDAFDNQDVPFERIVDAVSPVRDLSMDPVFQTMFQFQNFPTEAPHFEGVEAYPRIVVPAESAFDISMWIVAEGGAWRASVVYSRKLFDHETVERMVRHYVTVLEQACGEPDLPLSRVSLGSREESNRAVTDWNRTATDYPRTSSIHSLFEGQVADGRDRVALVCDGERVTYGELNVRANRLAHHLIELGVGRETVVGLFVQRDIESMVALLAILKAGGAYLPLNPEEPTVRLQFMIADGDAGVVITRGEEYRALVPEGVVVVDGQAAENTDLDRYSENPALECGADRLACLLYTSGSTGKPKGVEVLHRNVVRLVRGWDAFDFPADRVVSHLSSVWFDGSAYEIWGALLNGACCAINPHRIPTAAQLRDFYRENRVTTTYLVASMFNFVASECPEVLQCVREILTGGEAMSPAHLDAVLSAAPEARIFNTYGPTECGTTATAYEVTSDRWENGARVPIGKPVSNTTAYVLAPGLTACPPGIPGELCIGGDGVCRGYRNRDEQTLRNFVSDPFSGDESGRLYRTGDRCRYRADGTIEFLGRLDSQVKVRGFRIELGEIEAVLGAMPGVREVAATVFHDPAAGETLVGHVVPADGMPAASEIWAYLAERLPAQMVPAVFVELDALPLTPAGKLDRRRLPEPRKAGPREPVADEARDPVQLALTDIWERILGIEGIGLDDNFFEIGGHSLLALTVLANVERSLGATPALQALFERPTIRGFARVLEPLGS